MEETGFNQTIRYSDQQKPKSTDNGVQNLTLKVATGYRRDCRIAWPWREKREGLSHANRANKATEFKTIIEELHVKSAINRREQRTEKAVTLKRFSSKLVWNSELTE
nr:hypothetical protein Iba_chr11eCG13200 [Ipomoea batatas]